MVSSEHAGGTGRITLQYNADGTTTVTDAVNRQEVFDFSVNGPGLRKTTGVTVAGQKKATTYAAPWDNPQQRVASETDEAGRVTSHGYDIHHLISRTEAAGTAQARTTTFQYLSDYNNLPTLITSPSVYGTASRRLYSTLGIR